MAYWIWFRHNFFQGLPYLWNGQAVSCIFPCIFWGWHCSLACRTPSHKGCLKFSGTLVYPSCPDKLGQTLSAFAHFVYECSGNEFVFADIQGHFLTFQSGNWALSQTFRIPNDDSGCQHSCSFWSNVSLPPVICIFHSEHFSNLILT